MPVTKRLGSGSLVMSNGLILSPAVMGAQVTSLDLHFEPSVGIIAKKLNTLGRELKDFRTPLRRAIQQVVIPSIQMNFHKHGRPRWEPLADNTVANKNGNLVPLQRTGALMAGMRSLDLWTISRQTAFIADLPQSIWYGKVHQAGYEAQRETFTIKNVSTGQSETHTLHDIGAGGIPARPFVMLQPSDELLIEQVFDIWLEEQIVRAGLR
jgi:phage gpG-like protein